MDSDAFAVPSLQHSSSLDLTYMLNTEPGAGGQPPDFEAVLRSISDATSSSHTSAERADELTFDLPSDQLPAFLPPTSHNQHVPSSSFQSQPAAPPTNLQQLANFIQPTYNYVVPTVSEPDQLVPYSQPSNFSVGATSQAVVPTRRAAVKRRVGSKEERQAARKEQHAATDKQRRQTLAQLNTQLRDLVCSIGAVDGSGKVEQTLVLEKAIEMIQSMRIDSDVIGQPRTKMLKLYNQPVGLERTGLQSMYDTLTIAYRYASEHVMQYEICFYEDPNFVATAASDALRAMSGVGFTTNEYYVLQDSFVCDWLESPESNRYMRQQMFGRRLIDPPFFSTVPTILNQQDLPMVNGDKQSWSDYLEKAPPQTLLFGLVQHTTGRGERWESIIAIGWVKPYNNRPGRKLMVATRETSRKLSVPSADQLLATLNQYNQIKGIPPARNMPPSDSNSSSTTSPYSASIADSTDGSSLSSASSVADIGSDGSNSFDDLPTFVGA